MTVHFPTATVARPDFLDGGNWELENLKDVTVLFGKNGSGKSLLLRRWAYTSPSSRHCVVPERGGDLNVQSHFLEAEATGEKRRGGAAANYIGDYRQRVLGRIHSFYDALACSIEPETIPPTHKGEVAELVNRLLPGFHIELIQEPPRFRLVRVDGGNPITEITALSSGEAQLLILGLDLALICGIWELEKQKNPLLLIDEPSAHLHPDLEVRLADFLFQLSKRFSVQIVIATHSTTLLSALGQFGGERTGVVFLNRKENKYRARPFDQTLRTAAACLGGHALMGPLFGSPLLIVEGDDDYRIWSQVPRQDLQLDLAVIPAGGAPEVKKYQKTLERILTSLGEVPQKPVGYALLDGDQSLPRRTPQKPQDFIRFLRLNCHEAENLYLTDEVLAEVGTTWSEVQKSLKKVKNGKKTKSLKALAKADRKEVDLKDLMGALVEIADKKNVLWTMRVAKVLGTIHSVLNKCA